MLFKSLLALALLTVASGALAQTEAPSATEETAITGPPPPLPDLSEPNSRNAESLAEPGSSSVIPKALRGSGAKAGGPANDLNSGGADAPPREPSSNLANVLAGTELFHGNYCGAGQRGEGLPPTDDLDAACMSHDACYDAAGYASCACDRVLGREASLVADRPGIALDVRRKALSVVEAAGVMACRGP
ncbi:hypothetical protein [Methylobacterium haplocladii]|uniref:Phospholipase A2 domain-containing protein n=1 Tax=Methylobacterium haplocladii TaxID=1176176 RepID=A0A512IUX0_9HYPH|nr:hypothetical protein [Methylobacterium haplocladii]GEP01466.1 hypothetical protein MHA02_38530 [Methylobacterium haplocladii]GLS58884.1 hypothetical protein GCM10007887_15500 [Methylobacterium haplocladii]